MTLLEETIDAAIAARAEIEARRARKPAGFDKQRFNSSRSWRALRYATLRKNQERYRALTCEVSLRPQRAAQPELASSARSDERAGDVRRLQSAQRQPRSDRLVRAGRVGHR